MYQLLGVLCFMIEELVNRGLNQKSMSISIANFKNQCKTKPSQNTNFQNKHRNAHFENL